MSVFTCSQERKWQGWSRLRLRGAHLHSKRMLVPLFISQSESKAWSKITCWHEESWVLVPHVSLGYCEYTRLDCMRDGSIHREVLWNARVLPSLPTGTSFFLRRFAFPAPQSLLYTSRKALVLCFLAQQWTSPPPGWNQLFLSITCGCWRTAMKISNDLTLNHDNYHHGKHAVFPQSPPVS